MKIRIFRPTVARGAKIATLIGCALALMAATSDTAGNLFIGTKASSGDNSAVLIGRSLAGSWFGGAHAVRDETAYNASGNGLFAYASFDANAVLGGPAHYNHLAAFQARNTYTGSGGMDALVSFYIKANHFGTGTITNNYALEVTDPTGAGPITNNVGIWFDPMTRGASNFAFYSPSADLRAYFGGPLQLGTAPQITAPGWSQYGSIITHDIYGSLISNPAATIIDGKLTLNGGEIFVEGGALKFRGGRGTVTVLAAP